MPESVAEPVLLTPGPLTTSDETKNAMLRDWGSRDPAFTELNARVRRRLVDLAHASGTHDCVPLQGSGTFAVEAILGTFVPPNGEVLILINGAYGRRMQQICATLGRNAAVIETAETSPPDPAALHPGLAADRGIGHLGEPEMKGALDAIRDTLADMAVDSRAAGDAE